MVLNKPEESACTPKNPTDLASLICEGKHAQIKNKYFYYTKNHD
jgi:hypothetical protein